MGIHIHDKDMHDIDWLIKNLKGTLSISHNNGYYWLVIWANFFGYGHVELPNLD
jgi:hypothetical protein